jgi:hypothetical protein
MASYFNSYQGTGYAAHHSQNQHQIGSGLGGSNSHQYNYGFPYGSSSSHHANSHNNHHHHLQSDYTGTDFSGMMGVVDPLSQYNASSLQYQNAANPSSAWYSNPSDPRFSSILK